MVFAVSKNEDGVPPSGNADERVGLEVVKKMTVAGLEQLFRSIQSVSGRNSGGEDKEEGSREGEFEGRESHVEPIIPSHSEGEREVFFSDMEKKWLRSLTLRQPELLDALCQNITRQQQFSWLSNQPDLHNRREGLSVTGESERDLDAETSSKRAEADFEDETEAGEPPGTSEHFEVRFQFLF